MNSIESIGRELMIFMRVNYRLDEVGDGKDELKFRQGKKTILTVYLREEKITFLLIFGGKEREAFESERSSFSPEVCDIYDQARTYHDGKWMLFDVTVPGQLEEIKRLIRIKKRPNRKPFPKDGAIYGQCGQRCDLCIHYASMDEAQRAAIEPHLIKVWQTTDWVMRCGGCDSPDCHRTSGDPCEPMACAQKKGFASCRACLAFPCPDAGVGNLRMTLHTNSYSADDIAWAILPYVAYPHENGK